MEKLQALLLAVAVFVCISVEVASGQSKYYDNICVIFYVNNSKHMIVKVNSVLRLIQDCNRKRRELSLGVRNPWAPFPA